jgi:tetratricopeptide (TPR) repeat protein
MAALMLPLLALACLAQQPDPSAGPSTEGPPMHPAEALAEALTAVALAEEGGPDAVDAAAKASKLANYVLALQPLNVRAKFVLARVYLLQGRGREALGLLREYTNTREGETDWLGFKLLGDIYLDGKYYGMAREKYEAAIRLNPTERDLFVQLARAELGDKLVAEAAEHARRAIELGDAADPIPEPYTVLALALLDIKRYGESHAAANRAKDLARVQLRNDPGSIQLLHKLEGVLTLEESILVETIKAYPEQPEAYLALARLTQESADVSRLLAYHNALRILLAGARGTAPNIPPELLYQTARLHRAVGQNEEAMEVLEKVFERDPNHSAALELRKQIEEDQTAQ